MKKVWQVENVSNGWAIYMVDQNIEYLDADGDNLLFDTKEKAQWFVDGLNTAGELHKHATLEKLRTRAAIEILNDAEVMHEFDDCVWIKVGIYKWEQFNDLAPTTVDIQPDCGTPALQEMQDRIDNASKDAQC